MRAGVPNDLKAFGVFAGNDTKIGVFGYGERSIHQAAVHRARKRRFGEARADISGHFTHGHGL